MPSPYYRSMPVRYREDRTTQAAARLLRHAGGKLNHMKLIKLLYLVERTSLVRFGRPITYDWYYSLPHGPVLSLTLNKINEIPEPGHETYWHRYISERKGHEVALRDGVPSDQLSPAEEKLIDEIHAQFGQMSEWQLRDYSHTLPEWQDPDGSRLPIEIRNILLADGLSEEDVSEVEENIRAEASAARLAGV